jgi:hypothetical protein
MQTFHPLPVIAKWEHALKQTQNISPGVQADIHPNPITRTAEKVNFTAWLMSHTVAASLIALVATGKDHCAVCYE